MSFTGDAPTPPTAAMLGNVAAVQPMVRRLLRRLMPDETLHDDLCQDVLVRLVAAADRVAPSAVSAYARAVTYNVVRSHERNEVNRARKQERASAAETRWAPPADELADDGDADAVREAVGCLPAADRELLEGVARGERPAAMPGALRVRLLRARARARVHYLVASQRTPPPSGRCVGVLQAVAAGDRTRQRSAGAEAHLADCAYCAGLGS